ncbi:MULTISPECIES: cytochrome c3 family protein [unclassified Mesorhizobium]|uniref:cytochrome c3 family protein n=1 Tax=unclassified Mesorhizobium TaxID=325217 RepID=UPI001CCB46B0|nr:MULTISPECIES: cytochrome c3 family protein [unclassified Mesorhizobium]MBZ9683445.1 cytochrome c family protein [Mesorhizobium sp. CO1-1-2]MBZ9698439.1 cytochrome c family protein [Mesorhizobium sp. CO1-1-9]MBZ9928186.1 cytochrome c family protein [Mesorhizobium sp. BR1-1-4]
MPQIFRPGANGVARFVLWGGLAGLVALVVLAWVAPRVNWSTFVARANAQPVPFSHKHHVGQLGIGCRYCHNSVEVSSSAGLPATEVCMTCHSSCGQMPTCWPSFGRAWQPEIRSVGTG